MSCQSNRNTIALIIYILVWNQQRKLLNAITFRSTWKQKNPFTFVWSTSHLQTPNVSRGNSMYKTHGLKSILNLVKLDQIWIVLTLFSLIGQQTELRLFPNQYGKWNWNPHLVILDWAPNQFCTSIKHFWLGGKLWTKFGAKSIGKV